jgi:hypothetical protein
VVHFSPRLGRRSAGSHRIELRGRVAQRALYRVERLRNLVRRQRNEREARAREQSGEIAAQLDERPRERIEAVLERCDLIATPRIEVPVAAARKKIESQAARVRRYRVRAVSGPPAARDCGARTSKRIDATEKTRMVAQCSALRKLAGPDARMLGFESAAPTGEEW